MEFKIRDIEIDQQGLTPTLIIGINLDFGSTVEAPIYITGRLISSDNKVVSYLNEHQINTEYKHELRILNNTEKDTIRRERTFNNYYAQLIAKLSQKAIDHIESVREKDQNKDVSFTLNIIVKYLTLPISSHNIIVDPLIQVNTKDYNGSWIIKQSDWICRFSPFLGLGNFLLLELEIPSKQKVNEVWAELYDRLFLRLKDIENSIRKGDWQTTMLNARHFYEGLKFDISKFPKHKEFKESLKQLFLDDNHSVEGFDNFYAGIYNFFNFISKFSHDKSNKTGEQTSIPNPTKEDAYFVFALALGLINIIGKKISKNQ